MHRTFPFPTPKAIHMKLLRAGISLLGMASLGLAAACTPDSPTTTSAMAPSFAKAPPPVQVDDDKVQCPKATFTSIQAAVDASAPGAVIQVCAGVYTENVNITHTVTLQGAQSGHDGASRKGTPDSKKEAIIRPNSGIGFNVAADAVVIDGFYFDETTSAAGAATSNAFSGYEIRNNVFNVDPNQGQGLYFNSADNVPSMVEKNYFDGNSDTGGHNVNGIFSNLGLHNATISQNTFVHNGFDGMIDNGSAMTIGTSVGPGMNSNVVIDHNTSTDDGSFVALFLSPGTVISNNTIMRPQGSALYIGSGDDNSVLTHNTISDGLHRGIKVNVDFGGPPSTNLTIDHNNVNNMGATGILLAAGGAVNSLVMQNQSQKNHGDGIGVESGSTGNTLNQNTMHDNTGFDANDMTVDGGTSGTANTWTKNDCKTSAPAGLCKK